MVEFVFLHFSIETLVINFYLKIINKKIFKTTRLWTNRSIRAQSKTVILVCKFLFRIRILFAPPITLLLVHRSIVFKICLFIFFYLRVFTDKKILRYNNTVDNMVFKVFFVISFPPCVPFYHPCLTSSWSNVAQS